MATFTLFNAAKESMVEDMNLGADSYKWLLTNTAPLATNSVPGDLTEIGAGNGYSAGGAAVTVSASSQTGGVYSLALNACTITASGGTIGPFRYPVLVNTTVTKLVGWLDYGAPYTLPDGSPFTIPAGTAFSLA